MHPHVFAWWKHAQRHAQRAQACGVGCGPSAGFGGGPGGFGDEPGGGFGFHFGGGADHEGDFGGGAFGVRRPLRFLTYKLDLSEDQVAELARILTELKTERAQAAVDYRRTTASLADALGGESFDHDRATQATSERVKSAERLRDAVLRALGQIHKILNAEQRGRFAYLLRTGALSI
jgi:Spy/CpxP family protein refolding chaperone